MLALGQVPGDAKVVIGEKAPAEGGAVAEDSEAYRSAIELGRRALPEGHWAAAKDVKPLHYDGGRGLFVYGRGLTHAEDGKQVGSSPFAMLWITKEGKTRKLLTSDSAIVQLAQPLDPAKTFFATLQSGEISMSGNVEYRDVDSGQTFQADNLRIQASSLFEPAAVQSAVTIKTPLPSKKVADSISRRQVRRGEVARTETPRETAKVSLPEYVVEPPDIITVEVHKALPGRPIAGERLVRPDGRINLGYYGDVYVAGLTTTEIKAKVVLHLLQYLDEEMLGLARRDLKNDRKISPDESSCVAVNVSSFNSKVYYVQGDVGVPGRYPITGNETVLDGINYSGGLIPTASKSNIRLVRPAKPGESEPQVFPIDYEGILERGDAKTNYQLMPGDRLIVARTPAPTPVPAQPEAEISPAVEARLKALEQKLDEVLKAVKSPSKP